MRIEFLPGMTNVIRFPAERRRNASVELLREIKPDVREVEWAAAAFSLEPPAFDLYDFADRAMAEHILNHVRPEPGDRRRAELDVLLKPLLETAVVACWRAAEASSAAMHRLVRARSERRSGLGFLEEAANAASVKAAELLIEAYEFAQEALGAARAVELAKSGEVWRPRDLREDERVVFGI